MDTACFKSNMKSKSCIRSNNKHNRYTKSISDRLRTTQRATRAVLAFLNQRDPRASQLRATQRTGAASRRRFCGLPERAAATSGQARGWWPPCEELQTLASTHPRGRAPTLCTRTCGNSNHACLSTGPVLEAPCGGGAGLGRDRPRADPAAR
jgi:hypothetical protein